MFLSVLFCDILQLGGVAEMEAQYGKQIRKMRKAHNLTQEEFAKKSNISMMSLRRYETNVNLIADGNSAKYVTAKVLVE